MSRLKPKYRVDINESGHFGNAVYSENGAEASFGWEFGGSVVVVIDIPTESHWAKTFPFPVSRRREIAERVAREMIRQKATGADFLWVGNMIQITQ